MSEKNTFRRAKELGLTPSQLAELQRLKDREQNTYGPARARVQNALVRQGFAKLSADGDRCTITEAGLRKLVEQ